MFLAIYLLGYIIAYLLLKYYLTEGDWKDWTIGDRMRNLGFSLLSWIVILILIYIILEERIKWSKIDWDKKASW